MSDINTKNVEWAKDHETILVEWADKAMCYRWLHTRAHSMYTKLNTWYTIPVIIISTLTGTANFAQERIPLEYQNLFVMTVGGFNILAGIITTIQQFLKITQLNEAHRVSSIAWDKFYRNIKIELAKHPYERMDVTHMLKISKEEFDRLIETSPVVPEKIITRFKTAFRKTETYATISKPEVCDELVSTERYRNSWLDEDNVKKRLVESADREERMRNEMNNCSMAIDSKIDRIRENFARIQTKRTPEHSDDSDGDTVVAANDLEKALETQQ